MGDTVAQYSCKCLGSEYGLVLLYLCLSVSDVLSEEPQVCEDALQVSFAIGEETLSSAASEISFHIKMFVELTYIFA